MYLIDKAQNRIRKLEQKSFTELGFKERQHLQEWLAHNPESLGEELLIIQKEFDGFMDTNERLDLLAVDKNGSLVIIENKLDDTGRDVTWQVLKYASYCSTLTKDQIRNIYQQFLDKHNIKEDATSKLGDFLNQEYDEITLNQRQTQRIIMVAANFRKEVTSSALWLINFKLRIQCFRATPFGHGDQLFLTLEQIIPPKDTEDFVISMADKALEDLSTQEGLKSRHHLRIEFWNKFLPLLKGKTPIFQNSIATKLNWIVSGGTGISSLGYYVTITKNYVSISLGFGKTNKDDNKKLFDELKKYQTEIEVNFGQKLEWERFDDKISSRVSYSMENANIFNKEEWDKILNFTSTNMIKFEKVMRDPLMKVKRKYNETGERIE